MTDEYGTSAEMAPRTPETPPADIPSTPPEASPTYEPAEVPPESSSTPPVKKGNKTLWIILAVLGGICLFSVCCAVVIAIVTSTGLFPALSSITGPDMQSYTSSDQRLTLNYPEGWFIRDEFNSMYITSKESLLDALEGSFEEFSNSMVSDDALMVLIHNTGEFPTFDQGSLDPEELLNTFVYDQGILEDLSGVEVGPIETKMVGDYPAASMEISFDYGAQPGMLYIVLFMVESNPQVVMSVSLDESWNQNKATFDRILNSIEFAP